MEIIIGVILYLLVAALFVGFGRFLKENDERAKRFTRKKMNPITHR